MSLAGETILRSLVPLRRRGPAASPSPVEETTEDYVRWQFDSSGKLFELLPGLDLEGKAVLELGCGTGGRTAYVAAQGARRAVGIDINRGEIAAARAICRALFPELASRIEFYESEENERLSIGDFDVVLMIDTLEHVISPARAVKLAFNYTQPGGVFYFGTQGWYHHRGSHTNLIPFVNLFFGDETILNVIRWQVSQRDYRPTRFDSSPPIERWRGLYDLRDRPEEYLNKITIQQIKRLVRHSSFSRSHLVVHGFSRPPVVSTLVNPLRHVPGLQEVFHAYVVGVCQR